jgi:hypothetical protein
MSHSGIKFLEQHASALYHHSEEKQKSNYRDEFHTLFPSNRKIISLPSHNFNMYELYKSKCDRKINLSEIAQIRDVIYADQMEIISKIMITKLVKKERENMIMRMSSL